MARYPRKPQTTGSEHWLRLAISEHAGELDHAVQESFAFESTEAIEWLSPIGSDEFAEYRDEHFLQRLDILTLQVPLAQFWPSKDPQWDGLARTSSGRIILLEAKAYLDEVADSKTAASYPASRALIHKSLLEAQDFFEAKGGQPWTETYYQYANRLAHLYFLRELNHLDAYLIFLNFADAPDRTTPASTADWEHHRKAVRKQLGLSERYLPRVSEIVWSVPKMLQGKAPDFVERARL